MLQQIGSLIRELGSTGVLLITFIILGLLFRVKIGDLFKSSIQIVVGYFALWTFLGAMAGTFSPVAQGLSSYAHLNLPILDVGQGLHAIIMFAPAIFPFFYLFGFLLNLILLYFNLTRVINVDIWNYWSWWVAALVTYFITHSVILAVVAFILSEWLCLFLGEKQAKAIGKGYQMPGVTFAHGFSAPLAVFAPLVNWVIDRIPGINRITLSPERIQKKFHWFDSSVFGFIIAFVLSILAKESVTTAITNGVVLAAMMIVLPFAIKTMVVGVMTIGQPIKDILANWAQRRFKGKEQTYYLGLDCAIGAAHPVSLSVGVLLIPSAYILATILPGVRLLPMGDVVFLSFCVASAMPFLKMDVFRGWIYGLLVLTLLLYTGTWLAPILTQMGLDAGFKLPSDASQVSVLLNYPSYFIFVPFAKLFAHIGVLP